MEETPHRPAPNFSTIIVIIVLGALTGIGLYQASQKGYLPLNLNLPKFDINQAIQEQKVQTVITEENAVIKVVDKASPSVVAIGASARVINPYDPFSVPKSTDSTVGTGFIVSEKGIIVTNRHVVENTNTKYTVVTKEGKKFEIRKIYRDPIMDLAIVQVDPGVGPALEMGDSSKLRVGQTVIAIGNALGQFTNTVTTGIVSGLGRKVTTGDPMTGSVESLDNLIQTDAAINQGNSGGPLLNSSGQVIGVNVATTEGAQNIGFSLPINSIKQIVQEFIQNGDVSRPVLGIRYRFITKDLAILNEVPQGAYIQEVITNSSADKAGIKTGDIITKIDNVQIDSESKISEIINSKKVGDKVNITVWNDNKEKQITVSLLNLPE